MEFILCGFDSSFFNNNHEMVQEITTDDQITMEAKITYVNTSEYFTLAELEENNVQSMNPNRRCATHPND